MSPGRPRSYRQEVPTALRSRRLLVALAALLLSGGLVATALPDRSERRGAVGTEGDERGPRDSLMEDVLAPGVADPIDVPSDEDREAVPSGGGPTTTKPLTTSTTAGPAGTSTTNPPHEAAPRSLAGRIAWIESDAELGQFGRRVWSMATDGTDRRPELPHCSPGGGMGSWMDVSPDGTRVAIDCGMAQSTDPGEGTGVTVQDVATGRSAVLFQHGMMDGPTLRWSNDGTRLAASTFTTLRIIDADDLEVHDVPLSLPLEVPVLTWAPDDRTLLSEHGDVVDVATGTVERHPELVEGAVPGQAGSYSHQVRWGLGGALFLQVSWQTNDAGTWSNHYRAFAVDPANNVRTEVIRQATFLGRIEFLPDGRLLVNDGLHAAYSVRPDGTDRRNVPVVASESSSWAAARGVRRPSGGLPTTG
jgi:hypothetical protein